MKLSKYLFLLIIILISFTQSACKKSGDEIAKTNTDYLTEKPWVLKGYKVCSSKENDCVVLDVRDRLIACEVDDIYKFNKDFSFTRDMATNSCDPEASQIWTTTWNWYINDMEFTARGIPLVGPYKIEQINDNIMVLRVMFNYDIWHEYTFVHP